MALTTLLLPAIALLATAPPEPSEPTELKSRVAEASVFKNGLTLLTREVQVPAGNGYYRLDAVPEAIDGSFWYGSPDDLAVSGIETVLRFEDRKEKVALRTIPEFLAANVGKPVTLRIQVAATPSTPPALETLSGTLVSAPAPQSGAMTLRLTSGMLRTVFVHTVVELDPTGLVVETERTVKLPLLQIRFRAQTSRPARLQFVTLETGAAWVGSYLVTLKRAGDAKVQGKAQVGLGHLRFEGTNVKALAGLPTLPDRPKYDLAAGYGSLSAYLQNNQEAYRQYRPGPRDPYTLLPAYFQRRQQQEASAGNDPYSRGYYGGYGGGGFGGMGGGMGGERIIAPDDPSADDNALQRLGPEGTRSLPADVAADRAESLYAYPLGKLSLEPGDRIARLLFEQTAGVEHLIVWDLVEGARDKARAVVRLKNNSKVPWTGGPALILWEDVPLAQLTMPFTPPGAEARLDLGVVQDIRVVPHERTLSSEVYSHRNLPPGRYMRRTYEARYSVENTRAESVRVEVTARHGGEILESARAEVTELVSRYDAFNPLHLLRWSFNLGPGEKREIVMRYRLIVRTGDEPTLGRPSG